MRKSSQSQKISSGEIWHCARFQEQVRGLALCYLFVAIRLAPRMARVSDGLVRVDGEVGETVERDTSAHSEGLFNRIPHIRSASDAENIRLIIPSERQLMNEQQSSHVQASGQSLSLVQVGSEGNKKTGKRKDFSPETRSKRDIQNRRKVSQEVGEHIEAWNTLMAKQSLVEKLMSPHEIVDTIFNLFSNLPEPTEQIVAVASKVSKKKCKHSKDAAGLKFPIPEPKAVSMEQIQEECKQLKQSLDLYNHLNGDPFQNIGHREDHELSSYIIFSQEQDL